MPSRHEQEQQRSRLEEELKAHVRSGELRAGQLLPSVRALSEAHGVSIHVVRQALSALEAEGLLRSVQRVGTFVSADALALLTSPASAGGYDASSGYFALVVNGDENGAIELPGPHAALCSGFENRIAERGGTLLLMTAGQMLLRRSRGELPELRGVFDIAWGESGPFWTSEFAGSRVPHVHIGDEARFYGEGDTVSFDDEQGGEMATRHLMAAGHTRIAFLGLHRGDEPLLSWSAKRCAGWKWAMRQGRLASESLIFLPPRGGATGEDESHTAQVLSASFQARAARDAAISLLPLVRAGEVTAVVAANDASAASLLSLLEREAVPGARWPAIVGFDADPGAGRHWFTSLRLPWDELGRHAADLLWERAQGAVPPNPQHREVAMRLIPRLSSRPQWRLRAASLLPAFTGGEMAAQGEIV